MKRSVLIIPGNPSVSKYYKLWIKEIEKFSKNSNFYFAESKMMFEKSISSEEYFEKMLLYYENIFKKIKAKKPVVLIGHSIGGYFALKILEKYPDKIKKVILIFPFLGEKNKSAESFLKRVYFVDKVLKISRFIIKNKNISQLFFRELKFLSKRELEVCLRLAVNEYLYFKKNRFEKKLNKKIGSKIILLYNEKDEWCPKITVKKLKSASSLIRVKSPHNFIIQRKEREKITKKIISYIS